MVPESFQLLLSKHCLEISRPCESSKENKQVVVLKDNIIEMQQKS